MAHDVPVTHVAPVNRVAGVQPAQVLAGLVGLVYLAAGVVGFVRTGVSDWSAANTVMLAGLTVNPLHNLVHVIVGVLGALLAMTAPTARIYGVLLLAGFGLALLWGLAVHGVFATNPVAGLGNPLRLTPADNWLHLGTAVVGLLIAVLPARRVLTTPSPSSQPDLAAPPRPR